MKTIVRRATLDDLPWLLKELEQFSTFALTRRPLFDPAVTPDVVRGLIERFVFFVAERGSELQGLACGMLGPHFLNPTIKVFSEVLWWVPESHRGGRAGLLLLEELTRYGREHADWVVMTLEALSPVNDNCLRKRGYLLRERSYVLEVS